MKNSATIVQLATPNIDLYAKFSIASVNEYCRFHRYPHFVQRSKTVSELHVNWSKIDLLQHALEKFDSKWIVLVDADTLVADRSQTIGFFIEQFGNEQTHIMMSMDTLVLRLMWKYPRPARKKRPNAGFIILRNSNLGRKIITHWLQAASGEGALYNDIHPRNQLVYWNFVMPNYLEHQVILPGYIMSKPYLFSRWLKTMPFLYHLSSSSASQRCKKMRSLYYQLNSKGYLNPICQQLANHREGLMNLSLVNPLSPVNP